MSEKKEIVGRDLKLKFDEPGADLVATEGDLETISAEYNLAQAIVARLNTEQGELHDIGHADYGSRLYELVGELNNERTRERLKSVVRDCLAQESRILEILRIDTKTNRADPNRLDIEITVIPIEGNAPLSFVYPFHLEVE